MLYLHAGPRLKGTPADDMLGVYCAGEEYARLERKVKVPAPDGKLLDGLEVPVIESTERWTEVKLEDGTILRVKPSVLSAIRIPGQFDPEGNPMYVIKATNTLTVVEAADIHKRGESAKPH